MGIDSEDIDDGILLLVVHYHTYMKIYKPPEIVKTDSIQVLFETQSMMAARTAGARLLIISAVIQAESEDIYCNPTRPPIGSQNPHFSFAKDILLMRQALLDVLVQRLIPQSLHLALLYIAHYSTAPGHFGKVCMHDDLQRDFYWPNVAADTHNTVRCYLKSPETGTKFHHHCKPEIFPEKDCLLLLVIKSLVLILQAKARNQFWLITTKRYSKITRVTPTITIMSTHDFRRASFFKIGLSFLNF